MDAQDLESIVSSPLGGRSIGGILMPDVGYSVVESGSC
jgi:hypothetical protein